jgi:thiosulfate dehydrogenase [quinone] large subunit
MPAKTKQLTDKSPIAWALLRISLGFIFLWAFFDKLFGLGFATCRDAKTDAVSMMCNKAWVEGGAPTEGFLKFGTKGPLADFYQGLAGATWVDWAFMMALLLIGIALIAGIALKLAVLGGSLLLFLMWTAVLLPENNPVIDDHIVYIFALLGIYWSRGNTMWSIRDWWLKQSAVKKYSILQ